MPTYISLWGYLGGIIYSSSSSNVTIVTGPSPRSWPKMWSSPQYPQGGWARNISSGRMSSRTIHCSLHYHGACHHNILMEDELAKYPQGGWARELFVVLFITMIPGHNILRENDLSSCPHGWWAQEPFLGFLHYYAGRYHVYLLGYLRGDHERFTYPLWEWAQKL